MEQRQFADRIITVVCFGVSGIALVLGIWIAGPAAGTGSETPAAGTLILAEAR